MAAADDAGSAVETQPETPARDAVGGSKIEVKEISPRLGFRKPTSGGLWQWRAWKRRRKPGSETRRYQCLQTREASGREEGVRGRPRRISDRRSSFSSGEDGDDELRRRRPAIKPSL
ncbi:hypothetical protein PR202_ga07069 [Eleusine coracana subsp. coracana]|uniref:Uncharacterized protein n=1 Tax=Eleusine coracana subsp. coracana TaxID=191504 RepID=A0AAV5BZW6_ELECO|nr:hypothetical protein PR202_ga07069 [Eleusine coracana subsp. coracana]